MEHKIVISQESYLPCLATKEKPASSIKKLSNPKMWKTKQDSTGNAPDRPGLSSKAQEIEENDCEGETHRLINSFDWLTNFNARGPP